MKCSTIILASTVGLVSAGFIYHSLTRAVEEPSTSATRALHFVLLDQHGEKTPLSDVLGQKDTKAVLLLFFPKGCSAASVALQVFREHHGDLFKSGVPIIAISIDPVASNKKLCDDLGITFPLLHDNQGTCRLYGTHTATRDGEALADSSAILLDRDGLIRLSVSDYGLRSRDIYASLITAAKDLAARDHATRPCPTIEYTEFGKITVNGRTYDDSKEDADIVIDGGEVRVRDKAPSRPFKGKYPDRSGKYTDHTPLTAREEIPWRCEILVIGTGFDDALPIAQDVLDEAKKRGVTLKTLKTKEAVKFFLENCETKKVNAILHVTC